MRKILSLVTGIGLTLICPTASVISCNDPTHRGGDTPTPKPPVVKNLEYYQKLLENTNNTIDDMVGNINRLKPSDFDNYDDYIKTVNELNAEVTGYRAIVEDCNYHIYLFKHPGDLTQDDKDTILKILAKKLKYLQDELATKEQYSGDYPQSEIDAIKSEILLTKTEIQKYIDPTN